MTIKAETVADMMMAWVAKDHGPFDKVLNLEKVSVPKPEGAQAIIRVEAIGLNFLDILSIAGQYQEKHEPPFVPGVEASGLVVATGPQSPYQLGDRVMTISNGAFAEFMVANPDGTFKIPDEMTFEDSAALQLIYQTSHMALVHRAKIAPNDFLLVHAGAGGVGTSAIQIGKAMGARVIATAGSQEKLDVCLGCGAEAAINYETHDFVEQVMDITKGHGADVIYDPVGGKVFEDSTRCIAFEGRIIVIGFASGKISKVAVNRFLLKNIDLIGLYWSNYRKFNPGTVELTQKSIYDLYSFEKIKPVIYKQYPFENICDGLTALSNRKSYGKVVVKGYQKS